MPHREQKLKAKPEAINQFLDLRRLPGKLDFERAGWILGMNEQEVGIVVSAELLKLLGKPKQNSPKYLASAKVEACAQDEEWMAKAMRWVDG